MNTIVPAIRSHVAAALAILASAPAERLIPITCSSSEIPGGWFNGDDCSLIEAKSDSLTVRVHGERVTITAASISTLQYDFVP